SFNLNVVFTKGNPVETTQFFLERGESQLSQESSSQFTPAEGGRRLPSITITATTRVSTYNVNVTAEASVRGTSRATATAIINTIATTTTTTGTSKGRGARGRPARGASPIIVSAAVRARIRTNNTREDQFRKD
ncbi:hypothetical protein AKJ16_DCAP18947, partial [Drosera capensis]